MTITDRDREAAQNTCPCWGDRTTGPPECDDDGLTCELHAKVAIAIAQAREEATRVERERCIRAMCWRCDHEAQFGTYQTVHNLNGWVHCEGMHYRWRCDANNLRDGRESWMQSPAIRARGED